MLIYGIKMLDFPSLLCYKFNIKNKFILDI